MTFFWNPFTPMSWHHCCHGMGYDRLQLELPTTSEISQRGDNAGWLGRAEKAAEYDATRVSLGFSSRFSLIKNPDDCQLLSKLVV